jgi:ribosome-associated toxin RatA of RatAB toxin-antitoxin module
MAIGLEEGPFRRFAGTWQLTPLAEWGCRVEFTLDYEFNASLLDPLAGPMFERSTSQLVDAFVRRAEQLNPEVPLTSPPENPP